MDTKLIAPLALFLLAACDGNPIGAGSGDGGDPDTSEGSVYATDVNPELTMNSLTYDADADELVINNIPFDGDSGPDGQARYVRTGPLAGSFSRYESVETAESGRRQYYAVFARSASGESQVGAAGTNEYVDFGFGGATAQRTRASINLPSRGEYVYTGEYAAVRIYDETVAGGPRPGVEYITGDVAMDVDLLDFDVGGAIEGIVDNRVLYDINGNAVGALDDFISLATTQFDPDTRTLNASNAFGLSLADGSEITSGDWSGVFAGANGNEIAGFIVLEGPASQVGGGSTGSARETGVFIAID